MLFENKKFDGIGRSFSLVSHSFWSVFGVKMLYMLISIVFAIVVIIICGIITGIVIAILYATKLMDGASGSDNMIMIFYAVFIIVYIPLGFVINTLECALNVLIFFNQKIKFENFGVEYLANALINENPVEKT
jgi:hypothetical protein